MLKFLKKNKLIAFLMTASTVALTAVIVSTVSWYSVQMQITPDVDSGIILSYFESGDGSQGDPYVITRPVHYYNLVRLMEKNYEGFNGNNTYFEFGKDLDSSGTYKFYNYDNNGIQQSGYSTTLNMGYYAGDKALSPLGSANHPFLGNIDGHNLTVSNLHVTGKDRTDIGVFGYVGAGAQISNLYFNTVDIDLNVTNVSEVNAQSHDAHSTFTTFGYLAGHTHDNNSFDNVYVNNSSIRNSGAALPSAVKNNFGYIGYCDSVTLPNVGEEAYRHTLKPSAVHNYFENNYSSISGMTLKTRDTEYTATGSFSNAVSYDSGTDSYTFNNSNSKAYSLATAGYQKGDQNYIVQYKNGNTYSPMTGSTVTQTAPSSQTEAGYYVWYDSTNSKWQYYTVDKSGGQTVTKHYNVFSLSYHGVYAATYSTTYYLYYNSSTNTLDYTTTAPTSYANDPEYYFAFLRSTSDTGISYIEDGNGTSTTYYVYSPYYEKYMYQNLSQNVGTRTSLKFGDLDTATSASVTNQFTLTGPSGANISYNVTGGECSISGDISGKDNSPYGRAVNGQFPALSLTVTGASQSSRVVEDGYEYQRVTSLSALSSTSGDVITMVYLPSMSATGNAANPHGLSATQTKNNRGCADPTFPDSDYDTITYSAALAEISVERETISGTNYFRFKVSVNNDDGYGYLFVNSNNNYLRTTQYGEASGVAHNNSGTYWTITESSFTADDGNSYNQFNIKNRNQTSRYLEYNHSGNLFATYTGLNNGSYSSPVLYKRVATETTLYRQNAYDITATSTSEEIITHNEYDVYYYDPAIGTSDRRIFATAPALVNGWSLSGSPTTVTLAPESLTGWSVVTSTNGLIVGEKYIIASNGSNKVAKGYDVTNHRMNSVTATFNGDKTKITATPNGAYEFILGGNSSDGYTLTCSDGQLFAESAANSVNFTGNTGTGTFSIAIGASNAATISIGDGYAIKYNASGYFNNYSSGTAIQLYRHETSEPEYVGDKIGEGYSPDYFDTVGSIQYFDSYFRMSSSYVEQLSDYSIDSTFYNTQYAKNSLVIRIPNRGSLDYGTLTIRCGSNTPEFFKSSGSTVSFSSVSCSNTGTSSNQEYVLYLNKYNIYQLSYCVLQDISGTKKIIGAYDTGLDDDIFIKNNASIDEFVLVLGAPSETNVDISYADIAFSTITGNFGDFGKVGFRDSPGTVPGEIFSFTYDLPANGYVYSSVSYDSATNTYDLYFKSTAAITLYVYNYDANRAIVRVNGVRYNGPYNAISITASPSPGTSGWTSYS